MKAITYKIDKSRLFKRAWYLVKSRSYSIAYALRTVWAEMKATIKETIAKIELSETVQYTAITWTPSPEAMYNYYSSNCYKGD
jgi:hypothetical protein